MTYAVNTSVSIAKSKADIEELIQKAGASQFVSGYRDNLAVIGFSLSDRQIRFVLPLPEKNSPEFQLTPGRKQKRSEEQAYAAWEQVCRSRWRSLFLVIKAKLEAVDSGISTIEREFFYDIVQSINLEFIALRELTSMVQDMNDLDYQYTQESAEKVRNAALLYLNVNLRDKSYIYYLNSINNNENSWTESEHARQMKEDFAQVQAMRAALISTKDSDEQIILEDFEQIYSDEPGMTREKISEEILHEEKSDMDTGNAVQDDTGWQEIYSSYIKSIQDEEWAGYKLIYIDEDNVPELYIMGNSVAQGSKLCAIL